MGWGRDTECTNLHIIYLIVINKKIVLYIIIYILIVGICRKKYSVGIMTRD